MKASWALLLVFFAFTLWMVLRYSTVTPTSDAPNFNESPAIVAKILSPQLASIMTEMPSKRTSKWIVVTSIQAPTDDVKRLASYPDWTLVVVGDTKTPTDWQLPDVHYLSIETQSAMGFASVSSLPTRSYTRKNAGYLYAIANGAQWIYDTDDDNKPYGKGLDQFDYGSERTFGLRFAKQKSSNATIRESLFNPYRHFGRPDMWPRGFPLEHIKDHDHPDGSYRLCRVQRPPAVQQGIVQKDPDVDAIYRLLHADANDGLDESFSQVAPPVVLAPGSYAPWNSQNTLFSRQAFFGLVLPTTVAFRALLHAAGESISFVSVNAIQRRNAHNYLKDFAEEICTIELAQQFATHGFWGADDAKLVRQWVQDLLMIGYTFPPLRPGAREEYSIGDDQDLRRNCRRAHVSFGNVPSVNKMVPAIERAAAKIDNFRDLKAWCDDSPSKKSNDWQFPSPEKEATIENNTPIDNYQTVAIITNNWPWGLEIGLLQRMYEANFAMLIFCGNFPNQDAHAESSNSGAPYPSLKTPINYIDLSTEEIHEGYFMYYCLAKVEELKLQNVKGYVMFSDDVVYNFWNPLNFGVMQATMRNTGWGPWWMDRKHGFKGMKRTIQLFSAKYKYDAEVARFVEELKQTIANNDRIDATPSQYLMEGDGWANGDWMYVPASNMSFVAMFAQLAHEGQLFHELFTAKLLRILPSEGSAESDPKRILSLWRDDRSRWSQYYSDKLLGLHPVKLSELQSISNRAAFCDVVVDSFYRNIFGISKF